MNKKIIFLIFFLFIIMAQIYVALRMLGRGDIVGAIIFGIAAVVWLILMFYFIKIKK